MTHAIYVWKHELSFNRLPRSIVHSLHVWREFRGGGAGPSTSSLAHCITHPCNAILPTLVWTCLHAHGHTDTHNSMQVLYLQLEHVMSWECTWSQSQIEPCGRAPGRESVPALLTKPFCLWTSQLVYPWTLHTSHLYNLLLSVLRSAALPLTSARKLIACMSQRYL